MNAAAALTDIFGIWDAMCRGSRWRRSLHAADPDPGGTGPVGGLRRHLTPTVNGPAPLVETSSTARTTPATSMQKKWAAWTAFHMTGQPAINLPLHWTDAGLPVGVQFIGHMFAEDFSSRWPLVEQAHPWADRKPSQW